MAPKSLLGREDALALVIVNEGKDFNHPTHILIQVAIKTCIG
jgi:hypothetical protein